MDIERFVQRMRADPGGTSRLDAATGSGGAGSPPPPPRNDVSGPPHSDTDTVETPSNRLTHEEIRSLLGPPHKEVDAKICDKLVALVHDELKGVPRARARLLLGLPGVADTLAKVADAGSAEEAAAPLSLLRRQ